MDIEKELAKSYCNLLKRVDWNDKLLVRGLREGLNKFLSNAYLSQREGKTKYHKTHYISDEASALLQSGKYSRKLTFEHMVPKDKYIQAPCEKLAAEGSLTPEYVEELLRKYWKLATITNEENQRLHPTEMPHDWDGGDHLARYKEAEPPIHFIRSNG